MQRTIGWLAKTAGVKVPTIRFYEQSGLLPAPPRTESNRRTYDGEDARRLGFIRHAREMGFGLDDIRLLLTLRDRPEAPCHAADSIARRHMEAIDRRIGQLTALKAELQAMVEGCGQGQSCECRVLEVIGDHGACMHHR